MKLVTFETHSGQHIGALLADEQTIVDFSASDAAPYFRDMLALIRAGEAGLTHARILVEKPGTTVKLSATRLLAPVPQPEQMRDFLVFEKHLRQARANRHVVGVGGQPSDPSKVEIPQIWFDQPLYYKCNRFSVIGSGADIVRPFYSQFLDYELEFGIFIGREGKNIPKGKAHEYIFGYCIFNDVSARDAQMREMQGQLGPAKGKDFDTGNVLGPWLVTADEIPDPQSLTMIARVNGEEWSRGSSAGMQHSFSDMIAHVSMDETIRPGEFFGSGTVGGGSGIESGRCLKPGDVVELEVNGLGILRNRIVVSTQHVAVGN